MSDIVVVRPVEMWGVLFALPQCPTCAATGQRCRGAGGHELADWHTARGLLFDQVNADLLVTLARTA